MGLKNKYYAYRETSSPNFVIKNVQWRYMLWIEMLLVSVFAVMG